MSELGGSRIESELMRWASVDQSKVGTTSAGQRDAGHQPNEIPAHTEYNALFRAYFLNFLNTLAQTPRTFDSLAEALDLVGATTPLVPVVDGEAFVVKGMASNVYRKTGDLAQTTVATGAVIDAATSGRREFWAAVTSVFARAGVGGAGPGWGPISPGGGTPLRLEADGRFLYVGIVGGFVILNPVTGAVVTLPAVVGLPDDPTDLASNGDKLVIAMGGATDGLRQIGTLGASPITDGNYPTHGVEVLACAIDHNQAYYGGFETGGNSLRAVQLGVFGAFLWSRAFTGAGAVFQLHADGHYLYVATATGAGDQVVYCLRRTDGATVWSTALPSGGNAVEMAVDDRYVWISETGNDWWALERASGAVSAAGTGFRPRDADGYVVVGDDGTTGVDSRYKGDPFTPFVKAVSTDINRRPFYALAAPLEATELGSRERVLGSRQENSTNLTLASAGVSGVPVAQHNFTPAVALEAGLYLVFFAATHHLTLTSTDGGVRFRVSAPGPVTLWPNDHQYMTNVGGATNYITSLRPLPLSGFPTFGVDAIKVGGGGASEVEESTIFVVRIA